MYVHALHTVHAVPDLRVAAGRFAGRFLARVALRHHRFEAYFLEPEASRYSRSVMPNLSYVRRPYRVNKSLPSSAQRLHA
jgi:hypothetical protein